MNNIWRAVSRDERRGFDDRVDVDGVHRVSGAENNVENTVT